MKILILGCGRILNKHLDSIKKIKIVGEATVSVALRRRPFPPPDGRAAGPGQHHRGHLIRATNKRCQPCG